ncbi:acyl carrier protein [Curtobacterium sp. AB451]|uniref:acyl carrier protein n=1 Tax=unclassified Curtobacterium TaxID=257496 RepID=UPI0003470B0E|nr:acyl carrier protein [Curtobacterium sp. B18]
MHQDPTTAATPVALATPTTELAVRRALADHGRLVVDAMDVASIADLYALGLTSHATVNVMLAVENELDVEFPDAALHRSTFATIESIATAAESAA